MFLEEKKKVKAFLFMNLIFVDGAHWYCFLWSFDRGIVSSIHRWLDIKIWILYMLRRNEVFRDGGEMYDKKSCSFWNCVVTGVQDEEGGMIIYQVVFYSCKDCFVGRSDIG